MRTWSVILSAFLATIPAFVADRPASGQHPAHQHGAARLLVSLEGRALQVGYEGPAENMLGFEHAPTTDAQRKTMSRTDELLKQPARLFVIPQALLAVSGLVALVGVSGMMTALLTGLDERRREMAVLRSVGAQPRHVLTLIVGEAIALAAAGLVLGVTLLYGGLFAARPLIQSWLGLALDIGLPGAHEWLLLAGVLLAALVSGLWPAVRAYRHSLADGMTVRV